MLKRMIPHPVTLSAMGAMVLPAGFVVQQHVSWEPTRRGKTRMLIHQGTFWGSAVWAIKNLHHTMINRKPLLRKMPGFALSAIMPGLAFYFGGDLARLLLPPGTPAPQSPPPPSARYVPSYLQQPRLMRYG